jgi:eukaryotic-like serine/threonine-protein kinase
VEGQSRRRPGGASVAGVLHRTRDRRGRPVAGRYLLGEVLGRGATGTVHRARDLRARRDVAAKVLHDAADAAALVAFVREQGHRVDHPHVLAPTGWAAEDDTVLITMELVVGGSLRDLLARERALDPRRAVPLLGQLLDALAAVHDAGVVHGDVKPANLLLRDPGHLLLADFGVATRVADGLVATAALGTPDYLPPERRAGASAQPAQDVYAAGVLGRRLVPHGPVATLWDSMTRADPERRPTAGAARQRLRELGGGLTRSG